MVSFSEHSPRARLTSLVDAVRDGQQVALATDAGTPGVSDPGSALVSACTEAGLSVVPIPGVSGTHWRDLPLRVKLQASLLSHR